MGNALEIGVDDNAGVIHDTFSVKIGIPELPACGGNSNALIFRDLSDTAITDDAIFLLAPDLSAFPLSYGYVTGFLCGPSEATVTLRFNVTSVTTVETSIPTLSTWALAITALSLMACGTIILHRRRTAG